MKKNQINKFILSLLVISLGSQAQTQDELILKCPMDDIGLTSIYKINFDSKYVVHSMEGYSSSQTYFFTIRDNKVFVPPSEYGEEVIDLSIHEVKVRAGYEGAGWRRYKCSKI